MWVIIYTSSIVTPNLCKSTLNNSNSIIQSSGSLVTSSNSNFVNFLRSLVLDAPAIGFNLLFNLSHACNYLPLGKSLVTVSSTIWKHAVSSCAKIRSLYAFLFSFLSIVSALVFCYILYSGILTPPLLMISYPSCISLTKNFHNHKHQLYLSPLKGIIQVLISSMLLDLPRRW